MKKLTLFIVFMFLLSFLLVGCGGSDSSSGGGGENNIVDADNDGFTENQGDCNDSADSIYPGATEIAGDGIDQDCSGSDSKDVYQIDYGYLQYRTYENNENNSVRGCLGFLKNGNKINESDITGVVLKSDNGSLIALTKVFYAGNYITGSWNESTSIVDFSTTSYSDFMFRFPDTTTLEGGIYTYEATTKYGETLTLELNYPEQITMPYVGASSINYEWQGDDSLRVNWTKPEGSYDQIRLSLVDQNWNSLLYISLPSSADEFVLPSQWVDYITTNMNPIGVNIRIQTRMYADTEDGNNYARGYSDNVEMLWNVGGNSSLTSEALTGYWKSSFNTDHCIETAHISFSNDGTYEYDATEDCTGSDDYYYESRGMWEIREGFLYFTETYISDPEYADYIDIEYPVLGFITSDGRMALELNIEEDIFWLDGVADGIYGSWIKNGEDSFDELVISDTGFLDYTKYFPYSPAENLNGPFTLDNDVLALDTGSETIRFYYTMFYTEDGTILLFDPEPLLYTKSESAFHGPSTPTNNAVTGSWTSVQYKIDCTITENFIFLNDGKFEYDATKDCAAPEDYYYESNGTWEIREGSLYLTAKYIFEPGEQDQVEKEYTKLCYILWDGRLMTFDEKEEMFVLFEMNK